MTAGWRSGRAWWLPPVAAGGALIPLYAVWWPAFDGPWAPFNEPRYVQVAELVPILTGIIALYGVLPRMDWIDLQSPKRIRVYDTLAAVALVCGFGILPTFARWLWSLSDLYTNFVPPNLALADPSKLAETAPYSAFLATGANIVIVLCLACLITALLGRTLGPAGGVVAFALLLVAQGFLGLPFLAGRGVGLYTLTAPDVVFVACTAAVSMAAYHWTAAGTRPIVHAA